MEPSEIAQVLAKCAAYDNRTVGRVDVAAWHEILGELNITVADALAAVTRHYRDSTDWAMPAHIRLHAVAARDVRQRQERHRTDALALPSRFESDEERDVRKAAGVAACRAALGGPAQLGTAEETPEPSALDRLREITPGPDWADPESEAA